MAGPHIRSGLLDLPFFLKPASGCSEQIEAPYALLLFLNLLREGHSPYRFIDVG
jgi:hypothetical protein